MRKACWIGAMVFLGITIGLLYLPTLRWLWNEWFRTGVRFYSHGSLVLLISVYLVWRKRQLFASSRPWLRSAPLVLPGLGLGLIVLFQRPSLSYTYSLSAYSLLLLILGVLLVVCGKAVTRQLLFPVLFLTLAIPLPFTQELASSLAKIVAAGSVALADVVGMDVVREGTLVLVNGYSFSIDPLCSSLNINLALFSLALPIVYIKRFSPARAVLFLSAAPLVVTAFKVLLVTSVYWMTLDGREGAAMRAYHGWAGMLSFGLSLLTILIPMLFLVRPKLLPTLKEAVSSDKDVNRFYL